MPPAFGHSDPHMHLQSLSGIRRQACMPSIPCICAFGISHLDMFLYAVFKVRPAGRTASAVPCLIGSWRPPVLPHRLQCSTFGRLRLNRRVRDGNGCFPQAHHHQEVLSLDDSTVIHIPYFFLRKEVIQPHLPIRLPCYDFTPVIGPTFGSSLLAVGSLTSGVADSHGVTGGVYKTRERIHRSILICDY